MNGSKVHILLSVFALPVLGMLIAAGCSYGHTSTASDSQQKRTDRDNEGYVSVNTNEDNNAEDTSDEMTEDNTEDHVADHTHDIAANEATTEDGAMYFPVHGNQRVLKLERTAPEETRVGEEYPYSIKVTNVSDAPAHNVLIKEHINGDLQLIQKEEDYWFGSYSNYDPHWTENDHGWDVGTLQPGDSQTLNLVGLSEEEGTLESCLSADFESRLCSSTQVTDPKITLNRHFVNENGDTVNAVYQCDEVYGMYQVKNVGSGATGDVAVNEQFNNGITVNGSSDNSYTSDTLSAGKSSDRKMRLQFNGNSTYTGRASASMGDVAVYSDDADLEIMKPELRVNVQGPDREFLERDVTHRVTVENTSDDPAIKSYVKVNLPDNAKQVSTSLASPMKNGRVNIGRMEAGESRTFTVTFRPTSVRTVETSVSAGAYCAKTQNSTVSTSIEGHPAIGMEVTDTPDPIKIGETTRYMINIKNQGTAADKKVRLKGILPEGTEFVRATGETEVNAEGRNIIFDVPRTLDPGESFSWEVHARATNTGSGYFTLELESNANSRTVTEEESTNMVE